MQANSSINKTKPKTQLVVGLMTVVAWAAEASFMAIQALSIDKVVVSGLDLTQQIYADAWQRALVVLVGFVLGCVVFVSAERWKWFAALSALLYLGIWYFAGTTSSVSLIEAFSLKWTTAKTLGTYASFVLRDVLLPLCFISILGITLLSKRSPRRAQ